MTDRLDRQIAFLSEADKLKSVLRASRLHDNSRFENSAEHSWHIMLFALVLADQAGPGVRIDRVLRMLLLHDTVEIDAGDNPIHGTVDQAAVEAAEQAAADRLFGLLPADQEAAFRALWEEFEAGESADAVFAKSIDRVQTPLANLANGGGSWTEYDVSFEQLEARVGRPVRRGAPALWDWLTPRLRAFFDT
ncbi:HD domain-containing protein [Roseobacter ponti]|uniref:HD domain-containing protein n=1 Tax=Roseobacter ponti TaxID=1891787 RepID=A0A858SU93_9RHOB|nr:HD domain-containing protein [Roseobacter ponti]QJF51263.1 HD domain-containing protein [Roseobacter ponti]